MKNLENISLSTTTIGIVDTFFSYFLLYNSKGEAEKEKKIVKDTIRNFALIHILQYLFFYHRVTLLQRSVLHNGEG